METFLYGLESSNHDFTQPKSFGKNIFTNAFPLSLAQYLAKERKLKIPLIEAFRTEDNKLDTRHVLVDWSDIIGTDPDRAYFEFEQVYSGYAGYTDTPANKSDVVISDKNSTEKGHLRPLEIKLVVVPTSSTANKSLEEQSCEIVVRPPTIQQLAFSIAHSYGEEQRVKLQNIISKALKNPSYYPWNDQTLMIKNMPSTLNAAEMISTEGIEIQTPIVLTAIWRTQGQKPFLEENAFDVFVWTDMAFLQLFIGTTRSEFYTPSGTAKTKLTKNISRPSRALVWLVKSLWDYSAQNTFNFEDIHSKITYGVQSDKAASFTSNAFERLKSEEFFKPRVRRDELKNILKPEGARYLNPERRLDAVIQLPYLINEQTGLR